MAADPQAPVPPREFPPARTITVADRGEFFLRDSGLGQPESMAGRPVVFMLHGWLASADVNFGSLYDEVITAGYRVITIDHRGHGRGLRPLARFRLTDCADDAAAVMRALGVAPAIVYGYSMGGAIAQLVAHNHPDVVAGLVLSGTAQHWQERELRRSWRAMPFVGFGLSLAPDRGWRVAMRRAGFASGPHMPWLHAEMRRHSARDIAEAGRELGRFDSRPWLAPLQVPAAVLVTAADEAVPPAKQRELAAALNAKSFAAPVRHLDVSATATPEATARYNPVLLKALQHVRAAEPSGSLSAT